MRFPVKDIAKRTRESQATAAQALTELESFESVVSHGQGPR